MYPHQIRLRGPWQCRTLDSSAQPLTVRLPGVWRDCGLAEGTSVRLSRSFGLPRRLDDFERVWLTAVGLPADALGTLNGAKLEAGVETDVTRWLDARNSVDFTLLAGPPDATILGDIALVVRGPVWLSGVSVRREAGGVRVRGTKVGAIQEPLDLFVLAGRQTLAQQAMSGNDIDLFVPTDLIDSVRVELVGVSTVWHGQECPLD